MGEPGIKTAVQSMSDVKTEQLGPEAQYPINKFEDYVGSYAF